MFTNPWPARQLRLPSSKCPQSCPRGSSGSALPRPCNVPRSVALPCSRSPKPRRSRKSPSPLPLSGKSRKLPGPAIESHCRIKAILACWPKHRREAPIGRLAFPRGCGDAAEQAKAEALLPHSKLDAPAVFFGVFEGALHFVVQHVVEDRASHGFLAGFGDVSGADAGVEDADEGLLGPIRFEAEAKGV